MELLNKTAVSEFFLLGLTDNPELQPFLFCLFLSIYLVTILGNLLIILAISSHSCLHTTMYFFLSNLSFTDICVSTITVPKMLVNIWMEYKPTSYIHCFIQIYFFLVFVGMENFLLVSMAYDCYVAFCQPLRYTVIMNPRFCVVLILCALSFSILDALLHSLMLLRLSFCTDFEIPHFFCELAQVLKFSCSDTHIDNILIYVETYIFGGASISGILFSYFHIVSSVFRIPSIAGKYKAFSTCGSHLSVVSLFYGTVVGVTNLPRKCSGFRDVFHCPSMLNPFIYSLRNRDMKEALRKLIGRIASLFL